MGPADDVAIQSNLLKSTERDPESCDISLETVNATSELVICPERPTHDGSSSGRSSIKELPFGWVVVFAVFMLHVVIDGVSNAFGSLMSDLEKEFAASVAEISFCQSVLFGITYGCGPLVSYLCDIIGSRPVALIGALLATSGYLLSIFVTNVWQFVFTYGVLGGLGFGFMYLPAIVSVSWWFNERRALATSIAVCGNGIGIFAIPPLTTYMLERFGLEGCLLLLAGICLNGLVFCSLLQPPPIPRNSVIEQETSKEKDSLKPNRESLLKRISRFAQELNWDLLKDWKFLVYATSSFLGALSCYVPYMYLQERAEKEFGVPDMDAAFLFSYLGGASVLGRLSAGIISDLKWANNLMIYAVSCIISGIATSFSVLGIFYWAQAVYAFIFGLTGGAIVALQSIVLTDLVGVERISSAFGILLFVQGVAVFIGPPLFGLLVTGQSYMASFILVGAIMCASGVFLLLVPVVESLRRLKSRNALRS